MSEIVVKERTPAARQAYAAGLRMGMEQLEYRLDCQGWWWPWFMRSRDLRALIVSMRQGADLIQDDASADDRPTPAQSENGNVQK